MCVALWIARNDPFASSSLGARQVRQSTCTWQFFLAKGSRTNTSKHPHQHSWANTRRCASRLYQVWSFLLNGRIFALCSKIARVWIRLSTNVCVSWTGWVSFWSTRKPMWSAECSSVFFERAEVLGNVSQHVRHVVVNVKGLKRTLLGRGINLESTVEIRFRWQPSLKQTRVRRTAFEILLLGVFPTRGFDGHHTVRTSGGMFDMWGLAARARTVRSVWRSRAHAAIGQRCLVASICCRATSSLAKHKILMQSISLTRVCSNAAADPSHYVVSL